MSVGLFGNNWRSTYEERIFQGTDGTTKYARSNGSFWSFQTYSASIYTPFSTQVIAPADISASLVYSVSSDTPPIITWVLTFANGEKRTFDGQTGNLTKITDRNGNQTQLTYDGSGRLTTVTDPASRHLYFNYASGSSLLVTSVTSDVGITYSYAYDTQGRLSQVTRPDATTINYTYNTQSQITAVTDSNGKVLESHTYDTSGHGLSSAQANGVQALSVTYQ